MKICDLTQFYSPKSGGVKRYVAEKVRYIREQTPDDDHILIIPGERDEVIETERARTYTIQSPLVSRTSRYRALLRLGAIERVLEKERPDIIESGDPYQVAWKAVYSGSALEIPVVGFYHSHFPEAYLRTAEKYLGRTVTDFVMDGAKRYIRKLYNRFARTIVPSPALGLLLKEWGVANTVPIDLGVDTGTFHPNSSENGAVRAEHGIPNDCTLLLYVGRLAQEKNTHTLFETFRLLEEVHPGSYHLFVVGDGLQAKELDQLRIRMSAVAHPSPVTWLPYCADTAKLAQLYRAADLFVHPGVQETFGLVTLEAQACGTPVIGIHGSYMDRIIHSDQTLWARENSATALAAAIVETSRNDSRHDGALLHEHVAAKYSWTETFTKLFAIYREVIAEARYSPAHHA